MRTKDILDSIINQRDVFQTNLQAHTVEMRKLHEDTKFQIEDQHVITCLEITQVVHEADTANQAEHNLTREEMRIQAERAEKMHEMSSIKTKEQIKSTEAEVIETIEVVNQANQAEHENTRSEIAELKGALRLLSEQMKARDLELKELLSAYNRTRSTKKRQRLGERSNAVTAALLALETMYRSLQVSATSKVTP